MLITDWPADPAVLRREIQAMRDAIVEVVEARIPVDHVRGIYFKGSASKPWDRPCDYVPELSDLDLHLWFHENVSERYEALLAESGYALQFAQDIEAGFLKRTAMPLHWPRPQILILNDAMRRSGNWSRSHAVVLRGDAYPGAEPTSLEDRETLLRVAAEVSGCGLAWMDKVGPQLWTALRSLNFRISPLPARLLSAAGAGSWVWQCGRANLLNELRARDFADVAELLEVYYAHAWAAFAERWTNPQPMRAALRVGLEALALASLRIKAGP